MKNVDGLLQKGVAALQSGRLRDAERCFRQAVEIAPRHFGALNLLTVALTGLERFDEAETIAERALRIDASSDATHESLRRERNFNTFALFGMNRVSIQKFQLLRRRLRPGFHKTLVMSIDAQGAVGTENLDRQRVEEFVGEDNDRSVANRSFVRILRMHITKLSFSAFKISCQRHFHSPPQCSRTLDQNVAQSAKEIRKLLFRPVQHILRKQPAAGAEFHQFNLAGGAQHSPHLLELPRQQPSEDGVHVARSVEIPSLSELQSVARVVAKLEIVKAKFHIARESDGSPLPNFALDFLP